MSTRREFIKMLGGAAVASPVAAGAQQPGEVRKIAVIIALAKSDPQASARADAFVTALSELGWTNGRNIQINFSFVGAEVQRIRAAAKEAIGSAPDVIVASTTPVTAALKQERSSIPIVFNLVSNPIGSGFIDNFARPGGTITGFTNIFEPSMGSKWLALLKEIAPLTARVGLVYNPSTTPAIYLQAAHAAAPKLSVEVTEIKYSDTAVLEASIGSLGERRDGALVVQPDSSNTNNRSTIIALAVRHRLPAVYAYSNFPAEGGLMSYGLDTIDLFRQSAMCVDRILRGARPADLPVQAPTKYELVINLKTARALGLEVPPTLLARADEVIE
jgi:putative tryptophan/tyrosine transport system substrate-binding protein